MKTFCSYSKFNFIPATIAMVAFVMVLLVNPTAVTAQDTTVTYSNTSFSKIEVSGSANVMLIHGDAHKVVAKAKVEDVKDITIKIKDNLLKVSAKSKADITVFVTTPSLESIKVSGAGQVESETQFPLSKLSLVLGGAANVKMIVQAEKVDALLSGAAVTTITGNTTNLSLKINGAAVAKLDDLIVDSAHVEAGGASSTKIYVTEKISGKVVDAASVKLLSEPTDNRLVRYELGANIAEENETESLEDVLQEIEDGNITFESLRKIAKSTSSVTKNKFKGHYGGLEIGINTYISNLNSFELQPEADFLTTKIPNSLVVNLNLFEASFPIIKNNFGLVSGIGIEFNNYKFEGNNYIRKFDSKIIPIAADTLGISFNKSKLSCSYLKIPFLLEYQTNNKANKSSFHISGGAAIGVRLRSHTKYMYEKDGKNIKEKEWGDFYLNFFRFTYMAKIGWGPLNFFAEYNALPLFRKNHGPELYPVSFGISLINWN